MNEIARLSSAPPGWDRRGLPGWTYHSQALFNLEQEHVFRRHWQLACHVSDIAEPGRYITLDIVGERILVLRDQTGKVGAFHNICRHRGSRLVAEQSGACRNALVCPFHGWVYNLDGTLRGAARPDSFPPLDKTAFGLTPIECEVFMGFVFIRLAPGPQPAIATVLGRFAAEMAPYGFDTMVPTAGMYTQESPVNWKSVRDVDNAGYHVAMAHPALQDLYGAGYYDEPFIEGASRSFAAYNPHAGRRWSVRHYVSVSPDQPHLPQSHRRAWVYWGLFPNTVIAATPESVQFYQEFPLSVGRTLLRGAVYRHKSEDRRQRLARYLAMRIDRDTLAEDVQLTIWSNEAMASSSYAGFFLSDLEYGLRTHHDHLRAVLPVMTLDTPPDERDMADTNSRMAAG